MFIPEDFRKKWLASESSPVDWCEDNYVVNRYIAEFANTVSNIAIILLPIFVLRSNVWNSYFKHVSRAPNLTLYFTILVGFGSIYFHGTLSLLGQFIDEIALVWVIILGYVSYIPRRLQPSFLPEKIVSLLLILIALSMSFLWFFDTKLFAFWLFPLNVPSVTFLFKEALSKNRSPLKNYSILILVVFAASIVVWFIDQFLCDEVKSIGMPGIHFMFHIFMPFVAYFATTVFAYMKAEGDYPHLKTTMRAWYLLPYVHCEKK